MPKRWSKVLVLFLITLFVVLTARTVGAFSFQVLASKTKGWTAGYTFEITEVQYGGWTGKSTVTTQDQRFPSASDMEIIKQRALSAMEISTGLGSAHNFVVGYIDPDTVDGQPVDRNAVIKELPRPRFWEEEYHRWSGNRDCNVMVQVNLDSSGKVSDVIRVNDRPVLCDKESDVIEAAQGIKFDPAVRNGILVTQRQLFLYRLH